MLLSRQVQQQPLPEARDTMTAPRFCSLEALRPVLPDLLAPRTDRLLRLFANVTAAAKAGSYEMRDAAKALRSISGIGWAPPGIRSLVRRAVERDRKKHEAEMLADVLRGRA